MRFDIGKRGSGEEISWPEIVFLVLLLAFIAVFFIFVKNNLNGSLIEEEIYAKKIALLLDGAQPNATILLDVSELNRLAVKSGEKEDSFRKIIELDKKNNSVKISLRLGDKGYSHKYFTSYNVSDDWNQYIDKDGNQKINYILKVTANE